MNTNRPWHGRHSAMPRDIIWQLSALIGVEQGGRQIQALYQAYKGALSGSYIRSACALCACAPASTSKLMFDVSEGLVYETPSEIMPATTCATTVSI